MITNQNKKHNKSFIHMEPAKKIKKPARIPPQTPPARGQIQKQKSAEVLPNPNPQKIVWQNRVRIEAPPHCPNTWRAEPQKEKCPFHFRKNHPPRKSEKARNIFSFWGCRVKRGGGGAFVERTI
jgi:hypothetical protein